MDVSLVDARSDAIPPEASFTVDCTMVLADTFASVVNLEQWRGHVALDGNTIVQWTHVHGCGLIEGVSVHATRVKGRTR
jgi:hypothetical protein